MIIMSVINAISDVYRVKYHTIPNRLTEKEDDMIAIPHSQGSIDEKGLVGLIKEMNTTVGDVDVYAVLKAIGAAVYSASVKGYTFNLPLFQTTFTMTGSYKPDGTPDPASKTRHKFKIKLHKGSIFNDAERDIRTEKTAAPADPLQIFMVRDIITKTINKKLTPNGPIEVHGNDMKIAGTDASCGLWFVDNDGKEHAAGAFTANGNTPKLLGVMVPALEPGTYKIKIVTQYTTSAVLKSTKTYLYNPIFTVE
jgi:hypothetical protein